MASQKVAVILLTLSFALVAASGTHGGVLQTFSVPSLSANVSLVWDAPEEGDPVSYILEAGSAPGRSDIVTFDTGTPDTTLLVVGVPPGTYYVRVKARGADGVSEPSNEIVLRIGGGVRSETSTCQAPMVPAGLTSAVTDSTVRLQWTPSTGATSYQIEAGSMPGASDAYSADIGDRIVLQTVAPPGNYFVRVRAKNGCGLSAPSNEIVVNVKSPVRRER